MRRSREVRVGVSGARPIGYGEPPAVYGLAEGEVESSLACIRRRLAGTRDGDGRGATR